MPTNVNDLAEIDLTDVPFEALSQIAEILNGRLEAHERRCAQLSDELDRVRRDRDDLKARAASYERAVEAVRAV